MLQFEVWDLNLKAVSLEELVPCTIAPENNKPTNEYGHVVIFNKKLTREWDSVGSYLVTCFTVGKSESCSEETK